MNKKIIILALVILLFIGGGLFFFFNRPSSSTTPAGQTNGNPFGESWNGSATNNAEQANTGNQGQLTTTRIDSGAVISKIFSGPVAGFTFIETGSTTIVRLVERGAGKLDDIDLKNPTDVFQKVSTDTQSRIVSAYFLNQGKDLIRFREGDYGNVDALYSSLSATSTSAQSRPIAGVILSFTPNYTATKGIFITQSDSGSVVSLANADTGSAKRIWSTALQDITAQGLNKDIVAVQNKPAVGLYGSSFLITNSIPVFYLDGNSGFKVNIGPDTNFAVFSDYTNTDSPIQIFDKVLNKKWNLFIPTVPEKCVWSKIHPEIVYCFEYKGQFSNLPDDWYLGKVFLDTGKLWKISAKTSQESVLADFAPVSEKIDVTRPTLSSDEKTITFINKRDGALWTIDLNSVKPAF